MVEEGLDFHFLLVEQLFFVIHFDPHHDKVPLFEIQTGVEEFKDWAAGSLKPHHRSGVVDMAQAIGIVKAGNKSRGKYRGPLVK